MEFNIILLIRIVYIVEGFWQVGYIHGRFLQISGTVSAKCM